MATYADKVSEAEFGVRLRRGDTAAIEQLFRAYFDRLYSIVFNQVGRNQAVAEDIVQETFLSAINAAGRFRGQSKPYTWLCSIAHHKVVDFYRRQRKEAQRKTPAESIDEVPPQPTDSTTLMGGSLEAEEVRQTVEQALLRLPPDYQEVLILKYVEEMSVQEISQVIRRSVKSVEGLLTRGRRALQAILLDSGEGL